MRRGAKTLVALAGALVAAQAVRFPRVDPPAGGGALAAPAEVAPLLRRACYDCHSNETRWPWYSAVAPVSWLIHHDVAEGRKRLNFSHWADYESDPETAAHKLEQIEKSLASRDMAPWYYRWLHPDAHLEDAERDALIAWARRSAAALPPSS